MNLFLKSIMFYAILASHFTGYGQIRNVKIEYKIIAPDSGSLFVSPSQIPVAFLIYNHGSDSLYSTDSFSYFISHELQYPNEDVEGRFVLGKDIPPGDSSIVFRDTSSVNWTFDKTSFSFQLQVLCSYFTPGLGDNTNYINITSVPDQKLKRRVVLRHDYLSSITDAYQLANDLDVYPNPVYDDLLNVKVRDSDKEDWVKK